MVGNDIRVTPGGLVTSTPPHLIGERGAAPFTTTPGTIDGFQNLISLNSKVAWALLNGSTDEKAFEGIATLFLGGNTKGAGDNVDVVTQQLMSSIVSIQGPAPVLTQRLNANGEISDAIPTDGTNYGALGQVFTTAGTVTVAAASDTITGAGTTWTTDVLTANYAVPAANLSRNLIEAGDIIAVGAAAVRVYFRIIRVIDDTHLQVFPTPTLGNPAIGAAKVYVIFRTGYGSYSRTITIRAGGTGVPYLYYAGNAGLSDAAGPVSGTVEAGVVSGGPGGSPTGSHYQAPKTVDAVGVTTGVNVKADDVAYYKGFLLYGSQSGISWSVAGFPTAFPFGATDFPAANISVLDAASRFVSFEFLGDQLVAIFEDSMWLVAATGAVPEFNFYKMPETLSIEHAARNEPCGISGGLVYGRPSCTGRGAIFYMSNRGVEQFSGGLAEEASKPISDAIVTALGSLPYMLTWDDSFDLVWLRRAFGSTISTAAQAIALVFSPGTGDWSTVKLQQVTGQSIAAITGGGLVKSRQADEIRLLHVAYYEVLTAAGTPGTNGGDIRHLTSGLDRVSQTPGLVAWVWNTPVIPLGLDYPDFSFGGFMLDAMTLDSASPPVAITWTIYTGSSPYNMVSRESNTFLQVGTVRKSTWISSLDRKGQKWDQAFMQLRFTSTSWVQLAGVILFEAKTQAKR